MTDDRSHTYLMSPEVNVILRSRGTHHVIIFFFFFFFFTENSTLWKAGTQKGAKKKRGKLRKIQIKNRFIEFDPQQVEGQLVPRLLRMLHDVLTTLLL